MTTDDRPSLLCELLLELVAFGQMSAARSQQIAMKSKQAHEGPHTYLWISLAWVHMESTPTTLTVISCPSHIGGCQMSRSHLTFTSPWCTGSTNEAQALRCSLVLCTRCMLHTSGSPTSTSRSQRAFDRALWVVRMGRFRTS